MKSIPHAAGFLWLVEGVGEQIADSIVSVHRDMTVSSLRFPGVNFDLSYESFRDRWRNPATRASGFWTYIDARDAAMTCRLALEAKFIGHEVFIASAAKNCMIQPTRELVKKYLPKGTRLQKNRRHPLELRRFGQSAAHAWLQAAASLAGLFPEKTANSANRSIAVTFYFRLTDRQFN